MSAGALPLIRFLLATHLRNHRWLLAAVIFAVLLIAGFVWSREPRDFFAYGAITAAVFAVQFGFADRESTGFDKLLHNLVDRRILFVSSVIATLVMLAALMSVSGAVASLVWRDVPIAWWHAAYWLLIIWTACPLTLLIEVLAGIRFPAAIALLLVITATMIAYKLDPLWLTTMLGNSNEAAVGSLRPLGKLLVFNMSWNLLPLLLAYVVWVLRQRLASGP